MSPERDETNTLWALIALTAVAIMVLLLGEASAVDGETAQAPACECVR